MKKYKIDHYLGQLPKEEYDTIIIALPKHLSISRRTFDRWRNYKLSSSAEIPVDKMFQIAGFFNVQIEDMFTEIPKKITMLELQRHRVNDIANSLGLGK